MSSVRTAGQLKFERFKESTFLIFGWITESSVGTALYVLHFHPYGSIKFGNVGDASSMVMLLYNSINTVIVQKMLDFGS